MTTEDSVALVLRGLVAQSKLAFTHGTPLPIVIIKGVAPTDFRIFSPHTSIVVCAAEAGVRLLGTLQRIVSEEFGADFTVIYKNEGRLDASTDWQFLLVRKEV